MKKTFWVIAFAVLFSLSYAHAQETLGCCINPGAGQLACTSERLLFTRECCPQPEANFTEYYSSSQNPNGPLNYAECSSNFFVPNKGCSDSSITSCSAGCCCTEAGGTVKPEAQCKGTGQTFHRGNTNCASLCPTPQCSDNIDNDNNGCKDFSEGDTGCQSPADMTESGGRCLPAGVNCNNPSYTPRLSGFEIVPVKGKKSLSLQWQDECAANSRYYELSRCEGAGCSSLNLIATVSANSFEDSSGLEFGKFYTYRVKAFYSLQSATPSIVKSATLGDLECFERTTANFFCMNNTAYFCNQINKLVPQGTVCPSGQICVVSGNTPRCFNQSMCSTKNFGLFGTLQSCEAKGYCFYDRSHSTVDYCFACNSGMSCYDYKTSQACTRDHCGLTNCQWRSLSTSLEIGVCVSSNQYNCQWCSQRGTPQLENLRSYNEILDTCTMEKSRVLSTGSFKCYFNNGISRNCGNVVCSDYGAGQCAASQISHDEFNKIVNPSNDECGIGLCQNINSACVKNADGDSRPDCANATDVICEQDIFAPNTTLIAISRRGIIDSLVIQVYDKRNLNGSYALQTESNYTTFVCLEPCGSSGHPYQNSTQSRTLIVSSLNVYDGRTGSRLFALNEGQNTVRYYSQDPSRNIGHVKRLSFSASANATSPRVLLFNVTNGTTVGDRIYTNTLQPKINIRFFEPAIITFARITNRNTGAAIYLDAGPSLSAAFNLSLEGNLQQGEYLFELNAKNSRNVIMDSLFSAAFIVDTVSPKINITPRNGVTVNSSPVAIELLFSEEVQLQKVRINSVDFLSFFTTANNMIFTASINLTDGSKVMEVIASDFAGNRMQNSSAFIIDSTPTQITLVRPRFGVSPAYTFDIIADTDNNAECKYDLDDNLEYEFQTRFTVTSGIAHTIRNFNGITLNDNSTHNLFVRCRDNAYGVNMRLFDLSVDTTAPHIKTAFAFPNPIVESPITTTLTIEADEPALCRYSRTSRNFESMENQFDDYDGNSNNNFKTISRQNITLAGEGTYTYFAACMNKAELVSGTSIINFTANLSDIIVIKSHTPRYFNSSSAVLAVETNKRAQCKYSETDPTALTGQVFGNPDYSHVKQLVLPVGNHTFYVTCKDQFRQQWSNVSRIFFTIDTSAPIMLFVNDTSTVNLPSEKTCNTDRLRVKFLGEDPESGIRQYSYTILRETQPITGPQNASTGNEWIWVENLALQDNTKYTFSVKAKNYAELEGTPKPSDGITVDTNICKPAPKCGDELINQPGEQCDGAAFGIISSCLNYTNFIGGTLKCTSDCKLDISGCTRIPACGNNELDPGESCDTNKFGAISSCANYSSSFGGGTLKCTSKCELDTSSCTEKPKCGNGAVDAGEACDTNNLGPLSGKCIDYSPSTFTDGNISCSSCKLDTSKCQGVQGTCGDAIINIGEACDGSLFGRINSCTDYSTFSGGTIKCTSKCELDTSSCTEKAKCGNSAIDLGETCDTNNLGPLSGKCSDYTTDFRSGNLKCTSCKLDTSGCEKSPLCGNSRIDVEELCDGSTFTIKNLSCSNYKSTFVNGTLACAGDCRISTSDCVANRTTVPPNTPQPNCKDRGTCEINESCSDASECKSRYCVSGKCKEPTCNDSVKNQNEADVDCGGVCSAKCSNGKGCKTDSDCSTAFCNFGACSQPEICSDGKLSPGEADADCGGVCPAKCGIGKACIGDEDCAAESRCTSSQCTAVETTTPIPAAKDTDGDGLPDEWEFANGLNPNDPSDAELDFDNDGLTNRQEYEVQNIYSRSTDPTEVDTDGDGFSDKEELDRETDPTDPESFPKSNKLKIILFIAGIIILVSGFGYLGYVAVQKKREKEFEAPLQRAPRQIFPQAPPRQPARTFGTQIPQRSAAPPLRERILQRDLDRKRIFEPFGKAEQKVEQKQEQKPEQKLQEKPEAKKTAEIKTEKKQIRKQAKPKEDVFEKLRTIAQEKKSKKSKSK